MIEQILTRENLLQAMHKVQEDHGSAGVCHMPAMCFPGLLAIGKEELAATVRGGKYLPQAIFGVEAPKGEGGTRLLGIPTVTGLLLQQAVLQVINARFEYGFSDSSYGFRPNRSTQQAVLKAQGYINGGASI